MSAEVLVEIQGHVARLILNRPDVRNAIGMGMCEDLIAACSRLTEDSDVRAVILTGAGGAFCAGVNLKERYEASRDQQWALVQRLQTAVSSVESLPMPVIAAINGPAIGGGVQLAAAADIRVAGKGAILAMREVALGVIPQGGIVRLSRWLGKGALSDLVFTARKVSATEALRMGLVDRVVPDGRLEDTVAELAATIAANAPLAVRQAKAAIRFALDSNEAQAWAYVKQLRWSLEGTRDSDARLAAFNRGETVEFQAR